MSDRIDQAQVRHVAQLSRLMLPRAEVERFTRELSATLDYVAQLDELDTSGVEPTSHAVDLQLMGPPFSEERLLSVAHRYQLRTDFIPACRRNDAG